MGRLVYSCSVIRQGKKKFYTLTIPIETLAITCFVSAREEDVEKGFQRNLDEKRAREIAKYIDAGGIIPNSIVLSVQEEAEFEYSSKKRSISFNNIPKAFLVLDGQHRIYGFKKSKATLRVPVVVFEGLRRVDEARLFIDINTKQKPVPSELLLDIKKLAQIESNVEEYKREIFDLLNNEPNSCLKGLMSASNRVKGKISRVTFNKSVAPFINKLMNGATEVYEKLNIYLEASKIGFEEKSGTRNIITNPILFTAIMSVFTQISSIVKDRYSGIYSVDNFREVMQPIFERSSASMLNSPGKSYKKIAATFIKYLEDQPFSF